MSYFGSDEFLFLSAIPVQERIADRLADLLFVADEVLGMLCEDRAGSVRWMEPRIRRVFDEVDGLMRQMTD